MSSQYEEDKIIADFFGIEMGFIGTFLDLGAGDGQLCSNTEELVKRGWSGWCVEPHAESFSALRKFYKGNRLVRLVQAAVSRDGRMIQFYHHDEQLSTGVPSLRSSDENYWMPSISTMELYELTNEVRFDFVSVDCEGMDQEIVEESGFLFGGAQLLCYEHNLPLKGYDRKYANAWKRILEDRGFYRVVGKTEGNTLIARE